MTNLHAAVQFLLENGYMAVIKGKYIVTAKFNKEILGEAKGLTLLQGNVPVVIEPDIPKKLTWTDMYKRFIHEAKVPARAMSGRGEPYQLNAYSEPGMKAFRKAIEKEGVDYPTLVQAASSYYASAIGMKVAIGRFMDEGLWRTYYDQIVEDQKTGVNPKKATKDEPYGRYRIG